MHTETNSALFKPVHPFLFLLLMLPFGIINGYLTVTLAFLYSEAGISLLNISVLVSFNYIPQIFKFLWAPLVDGTLTLKKWYSISCISSSLCLLALGCIPIQANNLPPVIICIILINFLISFSVMSLNSLAAHDTPEHLKGRVSGYIQAGNMGGMGVGGGAGLWLAKHMAAAWMSAGILGLVCMLCCLVLAGIQEPRIYVKVKSVGRTLNNVLTDVWLTLKTKAGLLALLILLIPISTGAAANLFSAIAKDWHTGADVVALVTGVVGGIITAIGSLVGGWICDRMDRKKAYLLLGLLQAACCGGMALSPKTPAMYITWTLLYALTTGLTYAGYYAVVLEAIGTGAAATKSEVLGGLSNTPIYYMTLVLGWAFSRWKASGMLYTEMGCAILAAFFFTVISQLANRRKTLPDVL